MKSIFVSIFVSMIVFTLLIISSHNVLACGLDGQTEAQFFGRIANLTVFPAKENTQTEHFTYQIEFDFSRTTFNPRCPLDLQAAGQNLWRFNGTPIVENNQEISGVMVFDSKTGIYHIE